MKIRVPAFAFLSFTIIAYILYCFNFNTVYDDNAEYIIWVLSVFGIISYIFCIISWKQTTGKLFDMYIILLTFAFLFNYGQCFMWAFGIHGETEFGVKRLFSVLYVPTDDTIIKTQMVSLVGLIAFHCGALLSYRDKESLYEVTEPEDLTAEEDEYGNRERNALYQVCRITIVISGAATLYESVRTLIVNSTLGYGATLYDSSVSSNNIITLLSWMFFASIVGLLIGSKYEKKTMISCYTIFAIYSILHVFAGDRGEWLYPLLFLIWMHNTFYKKLNRKRILLYCVGGILLVVLMVAIRNVRHYGVSVDALIEAIQGEENPITSAFFEMGQSMSVVAYFIDNGWNIYPFGNTYILAILGMVTEKPLKWLIPGYANISGWLSQVHLGISDSGIGFSMIAEAFENYGPYGSILFLGVLGAIYCKAVNTDSVDINKRPLIMFMKIVTAETLIATCRNMILNGLKQWSFSALLIFIGVKVFMGTFDRD